MGFSFKDWADFNAKHDLFFGDEWQRYGNRPPPPEMGPMPDEVEWDPRTGMPIGMNQAPPEGTALAYQWYAKEFTRRRNYELAEQARQEGLSYLDQGQAYLSQGMRASESYRPGGHFASSFYGARATMATNQAQLAYQGRMAQQLDEPDMLIKWRDARAERAQAYRESADRTAQRGSILQLAGTVIGGIYGGGAGAAAGGAIGGAIGGNVGEGGQGGRREDVITGNEPYYN